MTEPLERMIADGRTLVMGVVNVTPDSFSDGGLHQNTEQAADFALRLIKQGVDILDIGGESTAPDSEHVTVEEELARVLPVVEKLSAEGAYISVDTYKADVAAKALSAGARMINDVTAFRGDSRMLDVLSRHDCDITIMYSKDPTSRTSLNEKHYEDVVGEISEFLQERIQTAENHGISPDRIVIDPGMGAFVSPDPRYSLELLRRLPELHALGRPILIGASRKGFIGKVLDVDVNNRLEGSLACAAVAAWNGAAIVRVHDVKETRRVVRMIDAIRTGKWEPDGE